MASDESLSLIDLAREPDFALGRIGVRPSTREVQAPGGAELVEPRVMQVLCLLAERRGQVVSRDELLNRCWGGRAVSEDAISRCIQAIRRLAQQTGGFSVTTIPRVGYRLDDAAGEAAEAFPFGAGQGGSVARLRNGLILGGAGLVLLAVLALLALFIRDARRGREVIVDPISTPSAFAAQGLTGDALSARLLDAARRMQEETLSGEIAVPYAGVWEGPRTGRGPLGGLRRLVRIQLGATSRVSGELTAERGDLTLTVRIADHPGESFHGAADNLDAVVARAAEAIYRETDPVRYGTYLAQHGRRDEAAALFGRLSRAGPARRRALALMHWSEIADDDADRLTKARQAVALDSTSPWTWTNLARVEAGLGRNQQSLDDARQGLALWDGPRRHEAAPWFAEVSRFSLQGVIARHLSDYRAAAIAVEHLAVPLQGQMPSSCERCAGQLLTEAVYNYALAGDGPAMRRTREQVLALLGDPAQRAPIETASEAYLMLAIGDAARVAERMDDAAVWQTLVAQRSEANARLFRARALAGAGRGAEAAPLLRGLPADCYACRAHLAVAAANAGDAAGADALFRTAVSLGPRLPFAHIEWAQVWLDRGRPDLAIAEAQAAHALSPGEPRSLIIWGEALMRRGDFATALARFDDAAARGPNFGHVQFRRGQALDRLGRRVEALAAFRRAAALDLSTADRGEATRRLAEG